MVPVNSALGARYVVFIITVGPVLVDSEDTCWFSSSRVLIFTVSYPPSPQRLCNLLFFLPNSPSLSQLLPRPCIVYRLAIFMPKGRQLVFPRHPGYTSRSRSSGLEPPSTVIRRLFACVSVHTRRRRCRCVGSGALLLCHRGVCYRTFPPYRFLLKTAVGLSTTHSPHAPPSSPIAAMPTVRDEPRASEL
ncbi:hypothetical protein VTO73DRAFT_7912 [Trametes versicolor]